MSTAAHVIQTVTHPADHHTFYNLGSIRVDPLGRWVAIPTRRGLCFYDLRGIVDGGCKIVVPRERGVGDCGHSRASGLPYVFPGVTDLPSLHFSPCGAFVAVVGSTVSSAQHSVAVLAAATGRVVFATDASAVCFFEDDDRRSILFLATVTKDHYVTIYAMNRGDGRWVLAASTGCCRSEFRAPGRAHGAPPGAFGGPHYMFWARNVDCDDSINAGLRIHFLACTTKPGIGLLMIMQYDACVFVRVDTQTASLELAGMRNSDGDVCDSARFYSSLALSGSNTTALVFNNCSPRHLTLVRADGSGDDGFAESTDVLLDESVGKNPRIWLLSGDASQHVRVLIIKQDGDTAVWALSKLRDAWYGSVERRVVMPSTEPAAVQRVIPLQPAGHLLVVDVSRLPSLLVLQRIEL